MEEMIDIKSKKTNKKLKIVTALTSVLAVCGVGFGVWGLMQANNAQKSETPGETLTGEAEVDEQIAESGIKGLQIAGTAELTDRSRRYYLGVTDLDRTKDAREKDVYLIDLTKIGTSEGVKKYDMKTVLDKMVEKEVAAFPDVLFAGTTNATPKSKCSSYLVDLLDLANVNYDWGQNRQRELDDWGKRIPVAFHMSCMIGKDEELGLGEVLYSLDPETNKFDKLELPNYDE